MEGSSSGPYLPTASSKSMPRFLSSRLSWSMRLAFSCFERGVASGLAAVNIAHPSFFRMLRVLPGVKSARVAFWVEGRADMLMSASVVSQVPRLPVADLMIRLSKTPMLSAPPGPSRTRNASNPLETSFSWTSGSSSNEYSPSRIPCCMTSRSPRLMTPAAAMFWTSRSSRAWCSGLRKSNSFLAKM